MNHRSRWPRRLSSNTSALTAVKFLNTLWSVASTSNSERRLPARKQHGCLCWIIILLFISGRLEVVGFFSGLRFHLFPSSFFYPSSLVQNTCFKQTWTTKKKLGQAKSHLEFLLFMFVCCMLCSDGGGQARMKQHSKRGRAGCANTIMIQMTMKKQANIQSATFTSVFVLAWCCSIEPTRICSSWGISSRQMREGGGKSFVVWSDVALILRVET